MNLWEHKKYIFCGKHWTGTNKHQWKRIKLAKSNQPNASNKLYFDCRDSTQHCLKIRIQSLTYNIIQRIKNKAYRFRVRVSLCSLPRIVCVSFWTSCYHNIVATLFFHPTPVCLFVWHRHVRNYLLSIWSIVSLGASANAHISQLRLIKSNLI